MADSTDTRRSTPPKPAYPIESVDNALKLLLIFRDQPQIRVSDASTLLGVARSTAHRLLAMLLYHGFVVHDPTLRVYRPGTALIDVGLSAVRQMDIRRVGRPVIEQLSREVGETVHIGVRENSEVLFVDGVESTKALRAGDRTGMRFPIHCTASGKVILAQLDLDEVRAMLPARLPKVTGNTVTSRRQLETQLPAVLEDGYATNFGESEDDLIALAAPIHDRSGRFHGVLVVTAPGSRASPEWVERVATPAKAAAARIGADLA